MKKMESLIEKIYNLVGEDEVITNDKIIKDESYIKVYITYSDNKNSFDFKSDGAYKLNNENIKRMALPILFYNFSAADKVIQYLNNEIKDTIN